MATRFGLVSGAAVLVLSYSATAADDSIQQSQLILLHQPARPRAVQVSPEQARAQVVATLGTLVRSDYAQLFVDLQLTQAQIDTLTGLIAEHSTLTTGWSIVGVDFAPEESDHQRARDVLSQIEQFLGPAGFKAFEDYQDTRAERLQLRRLVRLLIAVGHPLTSEQLSQLVTIMREERGDQRELWPNSDEFDGRIKPRFAAVLSAQQREPAERYFAGRAERRHDPLRASSAD